MRNDRGGRNAVGGLRRRDVPNKKSKVPTSEMHIRR